MKLAINVLVGVAAVLFLAALFSRAFTIDLKWEPVVYLRGSVGLLMFAITLTLMQIRDK